MGSPGDNTVRDTHMLYDYGCWYLQIPNDNLKQGSDPYHNPLKLGSLCNMKISDMNNKNQYADSHVLSLQGFNLYIPIYLTFLIWLTVLNLTFKVIYVHLTITVYKSCILCWESWGYGQDPKPKEQSFYRQQTYHHDFSSPLLLPRERADYPQIVMFRCQIHL